MANMPIIFLSHGPPLLARMHTAVTACWAEIGRKIDPPQAIICISAHFEAVAPRITGTDRPETIHDFSGPAELFELTYPCPGSPRLAQQVYQRLSTAGLAPQLNPERGLDHGVWVPLLHMYPEADIPVVQVSIQTENTARHHYDLGQALGDIRQDGVLILASGGAVHNLEEIEQYKMTSPPPSYARDFENWLNQAIAKGASEDLIAFQTAGPQAQRCHPWPAEHFLPLIVAQGAAGKGIAGRRLYDGFMYGVLSMSVYAWD